MSINRGDIALITGVFTVIIGICLVHLLFTNPLAFLGGCVIVGVIMKRSKSLIRKKGEAHED